MSRLILFFLLFYSLNSFAQQYAEKQEIPAINTIINPGFESGLGGWSISASSTASVSSTFALYGSGGLRFTPTAASQTVTSKLVSVPRSLQGRPCQLEVDYYNTEATNFNTLQALDASGSIIASATINVVSAPAVAIASGFNCPSTSIRARVISSSGTAYVDLDSFYLGNIKASRAEITSGLGYTPVASVSATTPLNITGGASNPVIGLNTSGVTSGTYPKVTVDVFGRVTSGSLLATTDLPFNGVISGTYTKVQVTSAGTITSGTTLINGDLPDSGVSASTYTKVTVNSKGVITSGSTLATTDLPFSGVLSGTYTKVQVTSAGTITSGTTLVDTDIPLISADKIASGTLPAGRGGTGFSTYTTGDLLYASGTSLVKLPIGTAAQVLTVTGGSPAWATPASGGASNTYTLQYITSSTTLTTSTHISASALGGPYTVLLPTASSTGTLLTLTKTDAASHVITLQTQFGQTIAASSTSRLNTTDETLSLISSGTAWIILNRTNSSAQLGSGPINITATTTSPTKGAGDYDNVYAVRSGTKTANIEYKYRQGVAGTSGTGDYLFDLPFGLRFDPSRVFFSTSANVFDSIVQGAYLGNGTIGNNTNAGYCTAMAYDATRFRMACTTNFANHQFFGSTLYGLGGGTVGFSMRLINVPIENWPEK